MAKFQYKMQNILSIKYKLENQAKQEYQEASGRLRDANEQLAALEDRSESYYREYNKIISNRLNIQEINECKDAITIIDEYITNQKIIVKRLQGELEKARNKLNDVMKERKIHEKLKENQFEDFLKEIEMDEKKEIDELTSYKYNNSQE